MTKEKGRTVCSGQRHVFGNGTVRFIEPPPLQVLSKDIGAWFPGIITFSSILKILIVPQPQLLSWRQMKWKWKSIEDNLSGIWIITGNCVTWSFTHWQDNGVGCVCYQDSYELLPTPTTSPFGPPISSPCSTSHQSMEVNQFDSFKRAAKFNLKLTKLVVFGAKTHRCWI